MRHVDRYGRANPRGVRRVFRGGRGYAGRPLPMWLQVRPQKAVPTRHAIPPRTMPWYGAYLETLERLDNGRRVMGLLKATSRGKIGYNVELISKSNKSTRVVYRISNKNNPVVAFGIVQALKQFKGGRFNLALSIV